MSPEMQEIRGQLLHSNRFEAVAADGSNPFGLMDSDLDQRRHQLHKLLSVYEALGALTRKGLVDPGLVEALFPHAVTDCYGKASGYIRGYRVSRGQEHFAKNLEWLADSMNPRTPLRPTGPIDPPVQEGQARSLEALYSVVAARRLQWDNLLWQVPILSLTAQAFLFTIQLGGDSRQAARVTAGILSLVVTFLCVTLMARHRQAELFDAHWLEAAEKKLWPHEEAVHGRTFMQKRNSEPVDGGWTESIVPLVRGYRTWIGGLLLIGLAALVNLILAIAAPEILRS